MENGAKGWGKILGNKKTLQRVSKEVSWMFELLGWDKDGGRSN